MLVFTIPLGSAAELAPLFAYPNIPGSSASLADTILHWFNQTLARDGLASQGAEATVEVDGTSILEYAVAHQRVENCPAGHVGGRPCLVTRRGNKPATLGCSSYDAHLYTIPAAAPARLDECWCRSPRSCVLIAVGGRSC